VVVAAVAVPAVVVAAVALAVAAVPVVAVRTTATVATATRALLKPPLYSWDRVGLHPYVYGPPQAERGMTECHARYHIGLY